MDVLETAGVWSLHAAEWSSWPGRERGERDVPGSVPVWSARALQTGAHLLRVGSWLLCVQRSLSGFRSPRSCGPHPSPQQKSSDLTRDRGAWPSLRPGAPLCAHQPIPGEGRPSVLLRDSGLPSLRLDCGAASSSAKSPCPAQD